MEHDAHSSWRDDPSKYAIPDVVARMTTPSGPNFLSVLHHPTTFDKEGILFGEQPLLNRFFSTGSREIRLNLLVEALDKADAYRISGVSRIGVWRTVFPRASATTAEGHVSSRCNRGCR